MSFLLSLTFRSVYRFFARRVIICACLDFAVIFPSDLHRVAGNKRLVVPVAAVRHHVN